MPLPDHTLPKTSTRPLSFAQQRAALRFLTLILLVAYSSVLIVLGIVAVISRGISAHLDFVRTAYWLLAWPLPIAWAAALLLRFRWLVVVLTVPLIALIRYLVPFWVNDTPQIPPQSAQIRVLTMNYLAREEPQIRAGSELLLEANADIIALQEFGVPAANYLTEHIGEHYPYQALNPQEGRYNYVRGQGVFSRFPILEYTYWQYEYLPETHGNQRVVLLIEGQQVVLYNIHPWPPFGFDGFGVSFNEKDAAAYRGAIEDIYQRLLAETDPVIVAGDFNTGDRFVGYGLFRSVLRDGYKDAGKGMGYTYPACGISLLPSLIRLDYVFYSEPFVAIDADIIETCGISDHKAVTVSFALPPP